MSEVKEDLIGAFGYAHWRLSERLAGISDDEYFWQPVAATRTIRPDGARFVSDGPAGDDEPVVSTIAWRLDHIVYCLTMERNVTLFDAPFPAGDWPKWDGAGRQIEDAAPSAGEAVQWLARALEFWNQCLGASTDQSLAQELGPAGGYYASATRRAFALHVLDEFVHHGAEIALMRDLYANRSGLGVAD